MLMFDAITPTALRSRSAASRWWDMPAQREGCRCQECGRHYKVDVMIPNRVWEMIKPDGKQEGAGLLCGVCIMRRVEMVDGFACYELKPR